MAGKADHNPTSRVLIRFLHLISSGVAQFSQFLARVLSVHILLYYLRCYLIITLAVQHISASYPDAQTGPLCTLVEPLLLLIAWRHTPRYSCIHTESRGLNHGLESWSERLYGLSTFLRGAMSLQNIRLTGCHHIDFGVSSIIFINFSR